jgi:carotenoid cleavage dioxygenase-like enzyme
MQSMKSGLPHELDVHSLATLGPSDVGGQLETEVLAAHYRCEGSCSAAD